MESGDPAFTFCAIEGGIGIFDSYTPPFLPPVTKSTAWDYAHVCFLILRVNFLYN
jgi:hypothetical protein